MDGSTRARAERSPMGSTIACINASLLDAIQRAIGSGGLCESFNREQQTRTAFASEAHAEPNLDAVDLRESDRTCNGEGVFDGPIGPGGSPANVGDIGRGEQAFDGSLIHRTLADGRGRAGRA